MGGWMDALEKRKSLALLLELNYDLSVIQPLQLHYFGSSKFVILYVM
jgi:hypothetical protein